MKTSSNKSKFHDIQVTIAKDIAQNEKINKDYSIIFVVVEKNIDI